MLRAPTPISLLDLVLRMRGVDVAVHGDGSVLVSGLTEDSRRVRPGDLFVARRGLRHAAERFIPQAKAAGARALLCDAATDTQGFPAVVAAEDVLGAFGAAAQALAGDPSERLPIVGITGTNGKTTTLTLVADALRILNRSVATLGTLGFWVDGELIEETLTTPQPDTLAGAFLTALSRGAETCVMEVSSHSLSQKRVFGVAFEVAAFSNLSQDHLDFHKTMEDYAEAKASLFDMAPKSRVINVGDAFGRVLSGRHPDALTVSRRAGEGALSFEDLSLGRRGIVGTVAFEGQRCQFSSRMVGAHNADNLLLALGILLRLGLDLESATGALGAVRGAVGRLERCDEEGDDLLCLVDYAHTPDALANVLSAARDLSEGPLVCVFGCGGDRDPKKRAPMGEAAVTHADVVWVTTDNPRSEDPRTIVEDIRPGLSQGSARVTIELDRRLAIRRAISEAEPGSVVALCGKGHETYQLVGDEVLDFDDRQEARAALALRRQKRTVR